MAEPLHSPDVGIGSEPLRKAKVYLWNDKELALQLKYNAVSEPQKFSYFILYLFLFPGTLVHFAPESLNLAWYWNVAVALSGIILFVFLYRLLYKTNARGDGKQFIERYICLSIPVNVRLAVIIFMAAIILGALAGIFAGASISVPGAPKISAVIYQSVFYCLAALSVWYYFTRLNLLLKIASGQME